MLKLCRQRLADVIAAAKRDGTGHWHNCNYVHRRWQSSFLWDLVTFFQKCHSTCLRAPISKSLNVARQRAKCMILSLEHCQRRRFNLYLLEGVRQSKLEIQAPVGIGPISYSRLATMILKFSRKLIRMCGNGCYGG